MRKIGVLSNPLSRSNRRYLGEIEAFLAPHPDVIHLRLENFQLLRALLLEFSAQDIDVLIVNGGDGTVSAVLTEIYEQNAFADPPIIGVLPGGTSNTIAGDVGLLGNRVDSLRRALQIVRTGDVERYLRQRSLIRVSFDPRAPAVVGMFFGTAGVCDAINLRRRIFPQSWIPDSLAGAMTLAYVLANVLFGRLRRVLGNHDIAVVLDSEVLGQRSYCAVIATTLERIFLGSCPFWGDPRNNLQVTGIRSPADDLVRQSYRLLYGKDKQNLPTTTYWSKSGECVELRMQCSFNLDGEFFEPSPGIPVALSTKHIGRFLQC